MFAQARGHLQQNAMDLRLLIFQQAHQVVVLLDGLQRLDEYRLSAGRGAVRHALHPAALLHLHRNDEAFAANGDQLILHRAVLGKPPQIGAQRLLDGALLLLHVAANSRQLRRSLIVERAVGQDLVAEVTQQEREISQGLRKLQDCLPLVLDLQTADAARSPATRRRGRLPAAGRGSR